MKKLLFLSSLSLFTLFSIAQSDRYFTAMKSNLLALDTSFRNPANLLVVGNILN